MRLEFTGTPQEVKDEMVQFHEVFGGGLNVNSNVVLNAKEVAAATAKPKTAPKKQEPKLKAVKEEPKEEKPVEKVEEVKEEPKTETALTLQKVRKLAGDWLKNNVDKREAFKEMLDEKFNVGKVTDLTEDQYESFVTEMNAL